jgi:hypothetical protein
MKQFLIALACVLTVSPAFAISCGGYAGCRYGADSGPHFRHGGWNTGSSCSAVRAGCLSHGAGAACSQRYAACMSTGCWRGPRVNSCGFAKQ